MTDQVPEIGDLCDMRGLQEEEGSCRVLSQSGGNNERQERRKKSLGARRRYVRRGADEEEGEKFV